MIVAPNIISDYRINSSNPSLKKISRVMTRSSNVYSTEDHHPRQISSALADTVHEMNEVQINDELNHLMPQLNNDSVSHYLFSKRIVNDIIEKMDRQIMDMYSMKAKIVLGDMKITRSRAKKRVTGEPRCVSDNAKLLICVEMVE